jgi:hypothetical protein
MSDWGAGFATGIAVGLAVGLATGIKRKPWSEMTAREKRVKIWMIGGGVVMLLAGMVAFFLAVSLL